MALKWKIYYFFSLYLFVWGLLMLILTLRKNDWYPSFFPADFVTAIMLSFAVCKGFISAQFASYINKNTFYSKNQKALFLILYGTNALLTIAGAVFCFTSLPQVFIMAEHAPGTIKFYYI